MGSLFESLLRNRFGTEQNPIRDRQLESSLRSELDRLLTSLLQRLPSSTWLFGNHQISRNFPVNFQIKRTSTGRPLNLVQPKVGYQVDFLVDWPKGIAECPTQSTRGEPMAEDFYDARTESASVVVVWADVSISKTQSNPFLAQTSPFQPAGTRRNPPVLQRPTRNGFYCGSVASAVEITHGSMGLAWW